MVKEMEDTKIITSISEILNGAVGEYKQLTERYEKRMIMAAFLLQNDISDEAINEILKILAKQNNPLL